MKNRRNIVELKYPPENPNDIWLKDGKFYRSTSEGWIVIDSKTEYTSKESMIADNPKGGTIGIDKETGEASIYNDVAKQWSPLNGGGVTSITWQELKDKRNNGQLIPGSLYRITDYNCTTTQENTQSAGHQFDIVLLALSENKLAEEGWAMMHDNIYDVTFADGVTKKCWIYETEDEEDNIVFVDTLIGCGYIDPNNVTINEENKTATVLFGTVDMTTPDLQYNYFQNSNLSAWKVWYCLDNDKSRFAWASDKEMIVVDLLYYRVVQKDTIHQGEKYYGWRNDETNVYIYTKTDKPNIGDTTYDENFDSDSTVENYYPLGRGVIYRLIDEFNNDIKYDFKNIQFKRKLTDGQYDANGIETWCYTLNIWYDDMCQDASIVGNTLTDDEQKISGVHNNSFGCIRYDFPIEEPNTITFALGNNVILSIIEDSYYYGIYNNNFGYFFNNTIGSNCDSNIIGNYSSNNIIRNGFRCNLIGNYFYDNSIGENFTQNVIGNSFINNDIDGVFAFNFVANSFIGITISSDTRGKNYGNNGVELATKDDLN